MYVNMNFSTQGNLNTSFEIDVSGLGWPGVQSNPYPTGTVAIDYGAVVPTLALCVYSYTGLPRIYSNFSATGVSTLHITFVWEWSG
jgi:hypothetical protein